jgi:hypothetical protein
VVVVLSWLVTVKTPWTVMLLLLAPVVLAISPRLEATAGL